MTKLEETRALRADRSVHYNCCQAVLVPFCEACGIDRETAFRLGQHFSNGMRVGSVCGAVTGALMVLGMAGADRDKAKELRSAFQEKNGALDCATLLRQASEQGIPRKCHCDGMVYQAVELLEQLLSTPDGVE